MTDEISDDELVETFQISAPGSNLAFESLVRRYETRVFRTCARILRNHADAEDITQEVFVKVFRKLHGFERRSSFSTWLFSITRNECFSAISRRKTADDSNDNDLETAELEDISGSVENEIEQRDLLQKTLDRMTPAEGDVLISRFVSGLSIEEMSEVFHVSLSATKMRLYRAIEKFTAIANQVSDSDLTNGAIDEE
ncbi:MAG: RNA polymerase sigma-70 factor (ECF subfamily) [Gammaproteobacteria bacterium]|jgi:RNA polymerase sigma-70 factor (ECF subfamily)